MAADEVGNRRKVGNRIAGQCPVDDIAATTPFDLSA